MKKTLFFLLLLSTLSCSTDNDIKHEEYINKEISSNVSQQIETTKQTFTEDFINLPKNNRFETPLWDKYSVEDYGNFQHIIVPTLNSVGFREFDLIVIVKDTNSYYVLKSLLPQTFDSKTININGIEYQHTRLKQTTNSNVNEKYSTRSWMDEITITTTGGGVSGGGKLIGLPMEREELGGYGSDWTYDPSFDPVGGGGGNSSNEIIIPPAPEYKIIIDKTFEDNECVKAIYDKLGGTNFANKYIKIFDKNLTSPNLTFKISNPKHEKHLIPSKPENTVSGVTTRPSKNNYVITLNEETLDHSLEIVSTLIHETLHATIYRKMDSVNTFDNNGNDLIKSFPEIYKAYMKYEYDTYEHQHIANKYINTMKTALKDYDSSYNDNVYEALAWEGLRTTDAYSKLTQEKKNSLIKALTDYRTNNEKIECK
ncbi:hypothetical protein HX089_05405 [Myroides odoratimimus]|uniref:hypothetical protein n=1 Tax=Myroides odoratimimus TaxID=76832 RepID=UPI0025767854|nr:hypothetical protein [Myroides odoratimimus]MDM1499075.1 hypothetical protein [Myroides odoratimimus]MDM1505399.1 hypothetical protein [Myroides odoratimimus]MDM1515826.1 hypothetical protein [Myroides odoratimimus]